MSKFPKVSEWRKWDLYIHTRFAAVSYNASSKFNLSAICGGPKQLLSARVGNSIALVQLFVLKTVPLVI